MAHSTIQQLLGDQSEYLLNHVSKTVDKNLIHTTGPDVIDRLWIDTDRNIPTLNNLQRLFGRGGWLIRDTSSFLWIRVLNILQVHRLHPIPSILILKIS